MRAKRFMAALTVLSLLPALCACAQNKAALRKEAEATRDLAEAYMGEGKYRLALRQLKKAETLNPEDSIVQNDLGLVYLALEDPQQAVEHFERALELNPEYNAVLNNLGAAYLAMRQWDKAEEVFTRLNHDLMYASPHLPLHNLGYVHYQKGNYAKAIEYYKRALEFAPEFSQSYRGMGRAYMAMRQYQQAIRALEKAVELAPQFAEAYLDLAEAYGAAGRRGEALKALNTVIRMLPQSALADRARTLRMEMGL
ncbi:MAG: tetratricopeptide repeat protein [Deltaproteobacteria bacterium]|nr:tetratricopeptide repeat protein [Deltaproteobacteria bacterium]